MKKRNFVLFLSAIVLSITSCITTPQKENESTSNKDSSFINGEEDYKKENIINNLKEQLNENNTFTFNNSSLTILSTTNEKIKMDLDGDLTFSSFSLSDYDLNCTYNYNNIKEEIKITSTPNKVTSLKHNTNMYLFNTTNEINSVYNYLNIKENVKTPKISLSSCSFSSIFEEAFSLLEESTYYFDSSINEYIFKNDYYNVNLDINYNLKSITSTSKTKDKIDVEFNFTNQTTSLNLLDDSSTNNLITTLLNYVNNSSFKAIIEAEVDDSADSRDLKFDGELNFDFTNSDLLGNNNVELSLKHYTNKDLSNDVYLRYQNSNLYFQSGNLIKGSIASSSISEMLTTFGLLADTTDFTTKVANPLNAILNNNGFYNIVSSASSLSSYNSNILKKYSLRNNVLSLTLNGEAMSMGDNDINLEIGLSKSLKLKTIKVKNLKVTDTYSLTASIRFVDFKELSSINVEDYPSYDFIPSMVSSLTSLVNNASIGGNLSLNVYNNSSLSTTQLGLGINADVGSLTDISLESVEDSDLAISNLTLNQINDGESELSSVLGNLSLDQVTYQDTVSSSKNNKSVYAKANFGNEKLYLTSQINDINALIKGIGSLTNSSSDINFKSGDMNEIIFTIKWMIDELKENEKIQRDLKHIVNDFSLTHLESFVKIINNNGFLELHINPEYLFNYEMEGYAGKNPDIAIYYNTYSNKIMGIYANISTVNNPFVSKTSIEFQYGYSAFDNTPFENVKTIVNEGYDPSDENEDETSTLSLMDEDNSSKKKKVSFMDITPIVEKYLMPSTSSDGTNKITSTNIELFNTSYSLSGNIINDNSSNAKKTTEVEGKIGLYQDAKNNYYSSGDIAIDSSKTKNDYYRIRYTLEKASTLSSEETDSIEYIDGERVYTEDNKNRHYDIKKYLDNYTLNANVNVLNEGTTPLKIYSSTNTIETLLDDVLNVNSTNIVYPYLSIIYDAIDNPMLLMSLINELTSGDYLSILKYSYFKDINFSINKIDNENTTYSVSLKLDPKILENSSSTNTYSEDEYYNISLSLNEKTVENDTSIVTTYSLNEASIYQTKGNDIINFEITNNKNNPYSFDKNNNLIEDSIITQGNSITPFNRSNADGEFVKYNSSNSNKFIDLDNVSYLLKLGINTTEMYYFCLEGNLTFHELKATILVDVSLKSAIASKYVKAEIKLYQPSKDSLTLKTAAHITIHSSSYSSNDVSSSSFKLNKNSNYVEYLTERITENEETGKEKEIAYILKTYLSTDATIYSLSSSYNDYDKNEYKLTRSTYYDKGTVQVENLSHNTPWYQSQAAVDHVWASDDECKEALTKQIDEINTNLGFNYLSSDDIKWKETTHKCYKNHSALNYDKVTTTSKIFYFDIPSTIYKYDLTKKDYSHYDYNIEITKLSQEEILGKTKVDDKSIMNILYYLLDYALIDSLENVTFLNVDVSHENLMGIIYYQVANAESSSSSNDYIGCIEEMKNIDDSNIGTFSLLFNLGKLANLEGINYIGIEVNYDKTTNLLKSIYINGKDANGSSVVENFNTLTMSFTLNVSLRNNPNISGYSYNNQMKRYDYLIKELDELNLNESYLSFEKSSTKLAGIYKMDVYYVSQSNLYKFNACDKVGGTNYYLLYGLTH